MLLILILGLILAAAAIVVGFFLLQVQRNRRPSEQRPQLEEASALGTCARCGQRRLLVKKEAGLCAFCWSSINTKPAG